MENLRIHVKFTASLKRQIVHPCFFKTRFQLCTKTQRGTLTIMEEVTVNQNQAHLEGTAEFNVNTCSGGGGGVEVIELQHLRFIRKAREMQSAFIPRKVLILAQRCGCLCVSKAIKKPNAEETSCALNPVLLNRDFTLFRAAVRNIDQRSSAFFINSFLPL